MGEQRAEMSKTVPSQLAGESKTKCEIRGSPLRSLPSSEYIPFLSANGRLKASNKMHGARVIR